MSGRKDISPTCGFRKTECCKRLALRSAIEAIRDAAKRINNPFDERATVNHVPIDERTQIGHVHLKVADLERAIAFYHGVLGFEIMERWGSEAAFLSAGGYHHHIALNTWQS